MLIEGKFQLSDFILFVFAYRVFFYRLTGSNDGKLAN